MNDAQFKEFLEANERATDRAIEKYVNGGIRRIRDDLKSHAEDDRKYQEGDMKFKKERLEPMLKVFEDNNIIRLKIKSEAGTIIFYAGGILTLAAVAALFWKIIHNL